MRFLLLVLSGLLVCDEAPNKLFYVCDSLLSCYYIDKQYENLKLEWQKLPEEKIPLSSYQRYLEIALANADTSEVIKWDSLFTVWQRNNSGMVEIRNEIKRFQEKERVVYQCYMQHDKNSSSKESIDSLFDNLLALCFLQNAFPNVERNGYGMDISIPLFHILSVSDSLLQERWGKVAPFIEKAFDAGEISNSYFFMYDRLLYKQCGKQYFGGMGKEVPMMDDADYAERKRRYLIDEAPLFLRINEQWKVFYKTPG